MRGYPLLEEIARLPRGIVRERPEHAVAAFLVEAERLESLEPGRMAAAFERVSLPAREQIAAMTSALKRIVYPETVDEQPVPVEDAVEPPEQRAIRIPYEDRKRWCV